MDPRTKERVERWDSRRFNGGYDELSTLADTGFSGAVTAGGSWLFMLNGRIIGVIDGDLESFEEATGTVYAAPAPALPLLCSMSDRSEEGRAKYYTNETPLEEVDQTLRDGAFTGYIELSEGVLSGDYYVVYYGGRRMAAAYIGNAERLLTDEDAFERAADEVGIYEVFDGDVEVTDIPGNGPEDADATTADTSADSVEERATDAADGSESNDGVSAASPSDAESDDGSEGIATTAFDERSSGITTSAEPTTEPTSPGITDSPTSLDGADPTDVGTDPTTTDASSPFEDADEEAAEATDFAGEETAASSATNPADESREQSGIEDEAIETIEFADETTETDPASTSRSEVEAVDVAVEERSGGERQRGEETDADLENSPSKSMAEPTGAQNSSPNATADAAKEDALEARFKREAQWRETRNIPSIDPEKTGDSETTQPQRTNSGRSRSDRSETKRRRARSTEERTATSPARSRSGSRSDSRSASSDVRPKREPADRSPQSPSPSRDSEKPLESDMLEREDKIDQLTQRVDELERQRAELEENANEIERERDQLRAKNEELSSTIDRLRTRVGELEEMQAAATAGAGDGSIGTIQLSPQEALSGTNLFVRYGSKSEPTLQTAHEGGADRAEVATNLQIEHHTGFEADEAAVAGQPYETFLRESMEYRFVEWLTETLLYEIRDTGNADALGDLYDVIPRIDRAELQASISLEDDDTEDVPDEVSFDVVAFDKMGTPLVVATLNDTRDPGTREMLEAVEEASSAINANYPDLGAAVVVTSSFFEPGALEVTEQATNGGFLSRNSRLSYVNLSRKQGYHLCLVEARSGGFHMNVPEL